MATYPSSEAGQIVDRMEYPLEYNICNLMGYIPSTSVAIHLFAFFSPSVFVLARAVGEKEKAPSGRPPCV